MPELPGQLPMFDVDPDRPRKAPRKLAPGKAKWFKYRPLLPFRCDDCVLILANAKGHGPPCRKARWRRVTADTEMLLCSAHAEDQRLQDGFPPLPKDKE